MRESRDRRWTRTVSTLLLAVGSASLLSSCGGPNPTASSAPTSTVLVLPAITSQPANQTVNRGQAANFAVVATGSGPLAYQWWRNGIAIPGATASAYAIAAAAGSDSGSSFRVSVTNSAGAVTSTAAILTIANPLGLARQFVVQGTILEFGPLALGNARTQILVLTNADAAPVQISNFQVLGSFTLSMQLPLTLAPAQSTPILVTFAPASLGEALGEILIEGDVSFTVGLHGTGTASHYAILSWSVNDTDSAYNIYRSAQPGGPYDQVNVFPVSGNTSFIDPNLIAGRTYYYAVTGLNDYREESPLSDQEVVVVPVSAADQSTIAGQPANQNVPSGGSATFTVSAQGTGLTYQWLRDGMLIPGATGTSFTIPAVSPDDNGSSFVVLVNSDAGLATSSGAVLTVTGAPGPAGAERQPH